jgi:hypothetical protein
VEASNYFGAYFGLTPVKTETSGKKVKSFFYEAAASAKTEPDFVTQYCDLLKSKGFSFFLDYSSKNYVGYIFTRQDEYGNHSIFIGKYIVGKSTYILVKTCTEYVEMEYSDYPGVPDFGLRYGVRSIDFQIRNDWNYYIYSVPVIMHTYARAVEGYRTVLENWGYKLLEQYSKDGQYFYVKDKYMVCVCEIEDSDTYFTVAITTVN